MNQLLTLTKIRKFPSQAGVYSVSIFAIEIFASMEVSRPELISLLPGLVRTLGTLLSVFLIRRCGRRRPLLVTGLVAAVSSLLMTAVMVLKASWLGSSSWLNGVLIGLMLVNMFVNGLGMNPIPWIICGEWPEIQHKVGYSLFWI